MSSGNKSQNSSTNLKDFQPTSARSSGSQGSLDNAPQQKKKGFNKLLVISISLLILLLGGLIIIEQPAYIIYDDVQFSYRIYCPVSYEKRLMQKQKLLHASNASGFSYLKDQLNRTYVVQIQKDHLKDPSDDLVRYCGYTRAWNQTCEKAKYTCTTPGPAFDFEVDISTNVFWVNNVREPFTDISSGKLNRVNECYKDGKVASRCSQKAKTEEWTGCTYDDPTNLGIDDGFEKVRIGKGNFPVSTHVHGLEVRPYFDGNPLSWFSYKDRGIGYMSAEQRYFHIFTKRQREIIYDFYNLNHKVVKFNVYPNTQLPGSLWYHDHAMASTGFNVMKGLSGMYILRDWKIENQFPKGEYEKMLLISINHGSSNKTEVDIPLPDEQGHITCTYFNNQLKSNAYYRFRILNSDFDANYNKVRFLKDITDKDSVIPFYVIGTDSSLIKYKFCLPDQKPSDWDGFCLQDLNTTTFNLASAERIDILIKFPSDQFPVNSTIAVTEQKNGLPVVIQNITIKEEQTDQKILNYQIPQKIDVPYTDLRKIPDSQVKKRMRPLVKSSDSAFGINGHIAFSQGASENPQIGTTEDWYLINTIVDPSISHPIHVHLINYQATQKYSLIKFSASRTCTFYEMQFYLENANCTNTKFQQIKARYAQNNIKNLSKADYQYICNYIKSTNNEALMLQCFKDFKNEDQFDENKISGLDVMKKESNLSSTIQQFAKEQGCDMSNYRYVCKNASQDIPPYQRAWKEVFYIQAGFVFTIRIRWTKTAYNASVDRDNYFHVDETDLIEFPGYVYHCHFLTHEDHEMMRPIMMRLSEAYKRKNNITSSDYWGTWYKDINKDLKCGPNNPAIDKKSKKGDDLRRI